jgi:glycosyltransferase involved in cell wall biosynthesis
MGTEVNSIKRRIRVAIFATHPIQYQVPLWRLLAARPEFEVHVCYGTDMSVRGYKDREFGVAIAWDTPLTEGYAHRFLSTDPAIQQIGRWTPSARGAGAFLDEFKPDVALLTAYYPAFHAGAFLALRRRNIPIVMRHEASDVALARSGWRAKVRDRVLRQLYKGVNRFAAIGTEARRHILRLGVPPDRIGSAPYCVDSDFVAGQVELWSPRRSELRMELGIGVNDLALVFSGKLIAKKDPLAIAAALRNLIANGQGAVVSKIHVIVAGDGEMREEVKRELTAVIGSRAHFLGFLNQREMGRAYAAGDCLVLPSRRGSGETWGLVVNEAMQYGLPAIVSDGVGCHPDLIAPGITGWVFKATNSTELADGIVAMISNWWPHTEEMRREVYEKAHEVSIQKAAEGLACELTNAISS